VSRLFDLSGKTAIVIGAASGIGETIAVGSPGRTPPLATLQVYEDDSSL
jgi:hypothetical protein